MAKDLPVSVPLDFYGDMLTEQQRDVIDLYYNDDLSLAEIAQNEGITRQGVRDSIKRGEAQLFEMEERLGLAKRFGEMETGLQSILEAARLIEEANLRCGGSPVIKEQARRIAKVAEALCEEE